MAEETVLAEWAEEPVEHLLAKELARCPLDKLIESLLAEGVECCQHRSVPRGLVPVPTLSRPSTPTYLRLTHDYDYIVASDIHYAYAEADWWGKNMDIPHTFQEAMRLFK